MSRSPRVTRNSVTRPFIKCFAFPQEHDIPLNEIRIECLHDTKNNIPKGGKNVEHTEVGNHRNGKG